MNSSKNKAFTLIEMLMVVVILAISALIVVPQMSAAGTVQLRAASSVIAADLEYAKSLSISTQQWHSVVFNPAGDSYQIQDSSGNIVASNMNPSAQYIVDFSNNSRLSRVNLSVASFDGSSTITFDYLGSPYSGSGMSTPMTSGNISLIVDGNNVQVLVEPVTGYIRIN